MDASRQLPKTHNPLMVENVPPFTDLVGRRRLGQTQLTPKMVQATSTADLDASNLGVFDYAHLRAPLPKGIVSGIFKSSPNSYFLMRRSQDGFVSATGMFKATFPYAEAVEEENERKYIKSLVTTSHEETAGNVWIPPEQALSLATEYRITPWIRALLDPADIPVTTTSESSTKKIQAPPKFDPILASQNTLAPPTPSSLRSTRARRSASPAKKRAIASPRKRSTKVTAAQSTVADQFASEKINGVAAENAKEDTPSSAAAEEVQIEQTETEPPVVLAPVEEEPRVQVKVDQDVKVFKGVETTHTNVEIGLPTGNEPPSAEEAARMIEEARAMVQAAAQEVEGTEASKNSKRKVEEMAVGDEEDEETGDGDSSSEPRSKKVKTEVELRKTKVRNRALVGISATLAIGAIIPYVMGVF
ncbi:hypothetical protein PG993_002981 [Apiospora rasikravindrae]|uniref:HTH APSES-type domain-containing protein n=1 Tax=Apiospora rasikravindrae TaxID=990691 RepID=A0ABR1TY79_9PEZI